MKEVMRIRFAIAALFFTASSISQGQAVPAGSPSMAPVNSSINLNPLDGVLHYALSASEVIQFGYYGSGNVNNSTALSGDVAYNAKSEIRPFSLLFAGGLLLGNQSGQGTTSYWNVSASQGYVTRHWVFNISDTFSFLPQSPTTGLSGIPGVGDQGSIPVQGPGAGPAGGILSEAGNRYSNDVIGSVERQISHNTSISGNGSYSILSFLNNNGATNNEANANEATAAYNYGDVTGTVAVNRRIDARSSTSLGVSYSAYNYTQVGNGYVPPDFEAKSINLSYQRILSHALSMSVSAGPQWVSSSNSLLIPSSLNVAISASLSYSRALTNASVFYTHGVNGGSGVLPGATADSISASLSHPYGHNWVASANFSYSHTVGLAQLTTGGSTVPTHEAYDTVYGGGQVTRRINAHFSAFASYTVQDQTSNYSSPIFSQNALNGTSQTLGIGITFTPRSTRLGQF
jgi:hypothetical protein